VERGEELMLKFLVKGQKIEVLEREMIASDQIAFVTLKFVFEGSWKTLHKVVQFTQSDETYNLILGTDGLSCKLPSELHQGIVKMSVFGYSTENTDALRATTVPITLNIRPSGFVGDGADEIPPTPDLYAQLLAQIESKISEVQSGKDGANGQDGFSPIITTAENSDGYSLTITDANHTETISILNGKDGKDGVDGQDGKNGVDGRHVELHSTGTEVQWRQVDSAGHDLTMWTYLFSLSDLKGADGKDGETPDISGYITTEQFDTLDSDVQQLRDSTQYEFQNTNEKILSLENQIQGLLSTIEKQNSFEVIFEYGSNVLADYGEKIYTYYGDGYRSLSGFVQSYPNFCCAENNYALSFNQTNFNWAGTVFVLFLDAVKITSASNLMLTYKSGATADSELYFVPKSDKTGADLARYIYDAIQSESAIVVPCKWLYSDTFITVLQSLESVSVGEYYLAFKGISDNSHPIIRSIQIMEG
jgi:hypothetical protein